MNKCARCLVEVNDKNKSWNGRMSVAYILCGKCIEWEYKLDKSCYICKDQASGHSDLNLDTGKYRCYDCYKISVNSI